jgi:hypothetical protein
LTPGVSLAPEQEGVLGRLLLAAVALLFVNVNLDLLNLEDSSNIFKELNSMMPQSANVRHAIKLPSK